MEEKKNWSEFLLNYALYFHDTLRNYCRPLIPFTE